MNMTDALKIIVAKSPAAMGEAIRTLQAITAKSPILQERYNRTVELALDDPGTEFTAAERAQLAEHLNTSDDKSLLDQVIHVRVTSDERLSLEQAQKEAKYHKLSEYIRSRLW